MWDVIVYISKSQRRIIFYSHRKPSKVCQINRKQMKLQQNIILPSPLLLLIPGSKIKAELGRLDGRQPNPPTRLQHLKK